MADSEETKEKLYERDDLDYDTLVEHGDELYEWDKRNSALKAVFDNLDEDHQTRDFIIKLVNDTWEPDDGWSKDGYEKERVSEWVEEYNIRFADEELSEEKVTEEIQKLISEADMPLNFESIYESETYSSIEDKYMQRKLLERCCHLTWKKGENVYVDLDIERVLERAGWEIPNEYSSLKRWVGLGFDNVQYVDSEQKVRPKSTDYDLN